MPTASPASWRLVTFSSSIVYGREPSGQHPGALGARSCPANHEYQKPAAARENFTRAGVSSLVTLVEGDAHQEVANLKEPVDLVFIDADKEGYTDYLNKLMPLIRPGRADLRISRPA